MKKDIKNMRDQMLQFNQVSLKILLAEHYESILRLEPIPSISTASELPVIQPSNSMNSDEVTLPPLDDMMATAAQSGSLQIGNTTSQNVPELTSNNVSSGKNSRKRGLPNDHSSSDGPANEMRGQRKRIV
ncbi:hypothetical protein OCU04_012049 [Sclerotinia nivalis]|uniref:Uncharacterized protein n=1 Tax=Sclerotinia nivalis TaxID=352851 RepID=A0A9X0DEW5_9HELO|nr:hypothetical protein OCU04_012049 [Sclerotinia nivalis]